MVTWRCGHPGCGKHSSYGVKGTKEREFCGRHAKMGMVDVRSKRCGHPGCEKHPSYGAEGTKRAEFCASHAAEGMVNVSNKRCGHSRCTTRASFGAEGSRKAEFCSRHAKEGMVDVWSKRSRCTYQGCPTRAHFGFDGCRKAEFCSRHAKDGMVDFRTKKHGREIISVSEQGLSSEGQRGMMHELFGGGQSVSSRPSPTRTGNGGSSSSSDGTDRFADERAPAEEREETAAAAWLFMGLRMKRRVGDDVGNNPPPEVSRSAGHVAQFGRPMPGSVEPVRDKDGIPVRAGR
ncbi:unnamed protein product [Ectocarpus sp. 12 AP-2014]